MLVCNQTRAVWVPGGRPSQSAARRPIPSASSATMGRITADNNIKCVRTRRLLGGVMLFPTPHPSKTDHHRSAFCAATKAGMPCSALSSTRTKWMSARHRRQICTHFRSDIRSELQTAFCSGHSGILRWQVSGQRHSALAVT